MIERRKKKREFFIPYIFTDEFLKITKICKENGMNV